MVQAEGGRVQDFAGISRVAWNRLKFHKPLQFDSTVFYAMNKHGTAITLKDEKYASPYNTYLHTGLPPGPIGNPGLDAITAALHPVKAHYLYFITDTRKKPYVTHFTNSLKQLQKWQQQFQN
jgi:peptidoglycan lytic transglycosylase G